jgi:hypothetical protein
MIPRLIILLVPALVIAAGAATVADAQTVRAPGAEVRAVRLTAPLRIDGRLDEEIYAALAPIDGFVQQLPVEGVAASEPTDLWVLYDEDNLYIAARCHDSQPDRISANELRRDNGAIWQLNDNFSVTIDTFHDRRNGFFFQTNPIGAVRDQAITDGSNNVNWNTVWDVKATRDERGYTLEMVIPFKSLRYRTAGPQTWGLNIRRVVRSKNEISNLTQIPAEYSTNGVSQMQMAATLVGVETPARSMNFELKPYVASSLTTDRAARVPFSNDFGRSAGVDVKYGLTRGMTADFTVNTDFAQVEEDQQQINLTRFNLFFPEKRDFFLEGQGIFDFGGQSGQRAGTVPIMFFSRRIGLSSGQAVPVIAGGRVTGKAGPFEIGALGITTGDKPSAGAVTTTFSALRLRRNILRRSSVGMIATGRWPAISGLGDNSTAGVDADFRFFDNVQSNLYWARTSSPGLRGDDASYRGRFNYTGDRYGFLFDHAVVDANFNPEVGFVRRTDFAVTAMNARFSPRLRRGRTIRQLTWQGNLEYITDAAGEVLEDRAQSGEFGIEFNSSDQVNIVVGRNYERLPADFLISPGVVVPAGGYTYNNLNLSYTLAQQRKVSGTLSASRGSFYGGTRTSASYSGRIALSANVGIEPNLALNWVRLPYGDFTARLIGMRIAIAPTARLGFSSFTQFNPTGRSLTSSARMRWEYTPGSELFVVYSDGRDTGARDFPLLQNRSIAVKATRLLRF